MGMGNERRKNKWAMLASLLFAVLLWVYVVFAESAAINIWVRGIPVTVENEASLISQGLVLVEEPSRTVDVKLNAARKRLLGRKDGDVTAEIDVGHITAPGTYSLPVSTNVFLQQTSVVGIKPSQVEVTVERLQTKEMTIYAETTGACQNGFYMETPTVSPKTVQLTGPASLISEYSVVAEPLDVKDANKDVSSVQTLRIVDSSGKTVERNDVSLSVRTAKVTSRALLEREIPISVSFSGGNTADFDISVSQTTALVCGTASDLSECTALSTEPVNLSGITGKQTVEVALVLPEGISLISENKLSVTVVPKVK